MSRTTSRTTGILMLSAALALPLAACREQNRANEPTHEALNQDTSKQQRDVTGGGMLPNQLATVQGQVQSLKGDELTLKQDQGGEITLTLTGLETKKSGETFRRDDLKEGTEVRASYSTQGRAKLVDSLQVVRPAEGK